MIKRTLYKSVRELLDKFPIVSITGPRQSGKTTFLKDEFTDFTYINLEDRETRQFLENDSKRFFEVNSGKIIFDEAQKVPELFSMLQVIVDNSGLMGNYILSGSQNFLLLREIGQSLAGRVAILKLLPYDYSELRSVGSLSNIVDEVMFKGCYPAIYTRNLTQTQFYSNYLQTYVERDIKDILQVKDIKQFRIFIQMCALRVGQVLNLNNLANDVGISQPTAKSWLSLLESSYLIFQLSPYYNNFNKVLVKSTKLYFYDTGLLSYLLNIRSVTALQNHSMRGSIFENMIITEIQKTHYHNFKPQEFYYWREHNKNEVDLLIPRDGKLDIFEIKSSSTLQKSMTDNINKLGNWFGDQLGTKNLIYGDTENVGMRFNCNIYPWNTDFIHISE